MSIAVKHVYKSFPNVKAPILKNISFSIKNGEFVSLTGKSGSGKSTLLYIVSGLDEPTKGHVEYGGADMAKMSSKDIHKFRNQNIGFVFQFHHLLPELTALENVIMPARKSGKENEIKEEALNLLDEFGLGKITDRYPYQMSGGEQQRVAIARALILDPAYIFADEPTGNLDTSNAEIVMKILQDTNRKKNTTIVMVTHEPDFAKLAGRSIVLVDGEVTEDTSA